METRDAIAARRNVRSFQQREIPAAELDRILEAVGPVDDSEFHRAQFDLGQAAMSMEIAAAGSW